MRLVALDTLEMPTQTFFGVDKYNQFPMAFNMSQLVHYVTTKIDKYHVATNCRAHAVEERSYATGAVHFANGNGERVGFVVPHIVLNC